MDRTQLDSPDVAPGSTKVAETPSPTVEPETAASGLGPGLLRRKMASRRARQASTEGSEGAENAVHAAEGSTGAPLPEGTRQKFEGSLGADLGDVRVHTGAASAHAAEGIGARAYTTGKDIHFNEGEFDPSSRAGQHLLAHEVAHTVQQGGGAQAPQCKLEVSSPHDAAEHEADAAADRMVSGAPAQVSGAPNVVARAPLSVADDGSFSLNMPTRDFKAIHLEVVEITPSLAGKIDFKKAAPAAAGGDKKAAAAAPPATGGKPVTTSAGVDAGPGGVESIKVSATKELDQKWGFTPKLESSVALTSKGPELSIGGSAQHDGFNLGGLTFGPFEVGCKLFEYKEGNWHAVFVEASGPVSAKVPGTYLGYEVTPSLTLGIKVEPDWLELGKLIAEHAAAMLTAEAAGAAAAIVAPLVVFAAGLAMWAKAGHELDDFEARARGAYATGKAAANLACGKDVYDGMAGSDKLYIALHIADVMKTATAIRTKLATTANIPEEAVMAAAKLPKSTICAQLYQLAWSGAWPELQKAGLAEFKDDWWNGSRQLERNVINSYATGPYSKSG